MRKYTNILLITLGLMLLGAIFLSAMLLRNELNHTNLNDPYRNFKKVEVPDYKFVSIQTGRTARGEEWEGYIFRHGVSIEGASTPTLYVHNLLLDSIRYEVKNDTLFLSGCDSKQYLKYAAIVGTNKLEGIKASLTMLSIENMVFDTLQLDAKRTELTLEQIKAKSLHLLLNQETSAFITGKSTIGALILDLNNKSEVSFNNNRPQHLIQHIDSTCNIRLSGSALGLIQPQDSDQ